MQKERCGDIDGMRGNPNGFLSSTGRYAPGLLSFRYTVGTYLNSHS